MGVRRSHNQDNFAVQLAGDDEGWRQRGHLFLVADGMGAHAVGEKASEQAADVIPHIYQKHAAPGAGRPPCAAPSSRPTPPSTPAASRTASSRAWARPAPPWCCAPTGPGSATSATAACYRIRDGLIEQLSYDHSLVWEYARLQHMDPDEVEDIPSNVIHRCLGPEPLVQVDVEGPHPIEPGDVYLLCSDGL